MLDVVTSDRAILRKHYKDNDCDVEVVAVWFFAKVVNQMLH